MSLSAFPPEEGKNLIPTDPASPAAPGVPVRKGNLWAMFREILETILFTLLIFFLVRSVIQNFKVEGHSMEPNLHSGQYIIVNRVEYLHVDLNFFRRLLGEKVEPNLVYLFHMPRRGEIVVFEYPKDTTRDYIKRVIGLPGETVEVVEGEVFINGQPLPPLPNIPQAFYSSPPVTLGPDEVFVMGDNRPNSSDSHTWGPLPLDLVIGKVVLSYWPPSAWGLVRTPPAYEPLPADGGGQP